MVKVSDPLSSPTLDFRSLDLHSSSLGALTSAPSSPWCPERGTQASWFQHEPVSLTVIG